MPGKSWIQTLILFVFCGLFTAEKLVSASHLCYLGNCFDVIALINQADKATSNNLPCHAADPHKEETQPPASTCDGQNSCLSDKLFYKPNLAQIALEDKPDSKKIADASQQFNLTVVEPLLAKLSLIHLLSSRYFPSPPVYLLTKHFLN